MALKDLHPRVLVVDDDASIRGTLADVLEWSGCDVLTARDGREAMRAVDREHVDVVLLDIRMPGLDGWGVLHEVRRLLPALRVIVMTSDDSSEDLAEARGVDAFLAKPFDMDELIAVVRRGGAHRVPA